jgi:lipoprotein NlpD
MAMRRLPLGWVRVATALVISAMAGCHAPDAGVRPDRVQAAPETYVVRSGDTLFGIARRFGLDHRDIARWNQLGDGTLIYPGQRLRMRDAGADRAPFGRDRSPDADGMAPAVWQWPTDGEVVGGFGQSPKTASGVLIAGREGQPVRAAADGEVVYSGSGLAGYGPLVIIRHNSAWLSAYGHNRALMVQEGQRVSAGQLIASMGEGAGRAAVLHFEIRRDGIPVDPLRYFPAHRP